MKSLSLRGISAHACALAIGMAAAWWTTSGRDLTSRDASGGESGDRVSGGTSARMVAERGTATLGERSEAYRGAWRDLLARKLPAADLQALQIRLLAEWVEVDPDAAVAAALSALESPLAYTVGPGLLSAFARKMSDQPGLFWPMIQEKRFGLRTALLQNQWLGTLGRSNPDLLFTYFDELSPQAKAKAVGSSLFGLQDNLPKTKQLVDRLALLPDKPESREMWKTASIYLSQQGLEAMANGLSRAQTPGEESMYLQGFAIAGSEMAEGIGDLRKQLNSLPGATGKKAALAVLNQTFYPHAIADVADYLMEQGDWDTLENSVPGRMNQSVPSRNPAEQLSWAAELPERQETEDLYRTAIRQYINGDPATARGWIEQMPAGWKRDNALAEYVNSSLNTRKDAAAAQWAMERIQSPGFRSTAEAMQAEWEASRSK